MDRPIISTWIVEDCPEDESFFPQVLGRSSNPSFQAVYWRCAAVFFYSSKLFNPTARHILFTNVEERTLRQRRIDGVALAGIIDALSIEVVTRPITHRLPKGTVFAWGNQFYILDIIDWLADQPGNVPSLVLDSDCVWRKPGEALLHDITAQAALSYALDASPDGIQNGLANSQLAEIMRLWGRDPAAEAVVYTGGEALAATCRFCSDIREDVRDHWRWTLQRAVSKQEPFAHEEAHFLTVIYAAHGIVPGGLDPYLKRIWTGLRTSNVSPDDVKLTIWHLPSEKRFGLTRLYTHLFASGSEGGRGFDRETFTKLLSVQCGVPNRGTALFAHDAMQRIAEKLHLWR